MHKVSLKPLFILSLAYTLFIPIFLPLCHLSTFSPFLAYTYHKKTLIQSLWISILCGLMIDLCTSQLHFGLYALNFAITTLLLFSKKRHFFDEKPLSLSIFTFFISAIATLTLLLLTISFDAQLSLNWPTIISDVFLMSIADALYAFIGFTLPIKLYFHLKQHPWKFLQKKAETQE